MTTDNKRILCYNYGKDCLNNAVCESDLADGKGVKFYCRKCIEEFSDDIEDCEVDESLVFCEREWNNQA